MPQIHFLLFFVFFFLCLNLDAATYFYKIVTTRLLETKICKEVSEFGKFYRVMNGVGVDQGGVARTVVERAWHTVNGSS